LPSHCPEEHVEREEIGRWIKIYLEGLTKEDRHIAFLRFKGKIKQHLEGNGYN